MNPRQFIIRQTALLALGEALCVAAMAGIFAMLSAFDYKVILGGALGALIAVGNFFFMAIASDAAADKAMDQDVKGGQAAMRASYSLRLVVMGVLLFVFAKSGHCNLIAMVIPLVLVFPILTVIEFFRKAGGKKV
jgi:hypothetical protein